MAANEIIIFTAINEEEQANDLLIDLVSDRLILSGTIYPVKVIYHWENEIHIDEEYKLMLKAREDKYPAIEKYIQENHHYRAPEIIKVDASFGSEDFKQFLASKRQ